jgi:hypothetical protein
MSVQKKYTSSYLGCRFLSIYITCRLFDGSLKDKTDYNWPASIMSYQTISGKNNYALYDMSGNAQEWCYD